MLFMLFAGSNSERVCLVPCEGLLDSFVYRDERLIIEERCCFGDIGHAMLHIASSFGTMNRLKFTPTFIFQLIKKFKQGDLLTARDIIYLVDRLFVFCKKRQDVCL